MKQTIFPQSRIVRKLYKRVKMPWGFSSEPDGQEEVFFKTEIDLAALDEMGRRAASNKTGICRDGALIVRVIERKRL